MLNLEVDMIGIVRQVKVLELMLSSQDREHQGQGPTRAGRMVG